MSKPIDGAQMELVGGEIVERKERPYSLTVDAYEQRRRNNAEIAARALKVTIAAGKIAQKANVNDPQSLLDCFNEYLEMCLENGYRVGNMSAYASMGVDYSTVKDWLYGRSRVSDPRYKRLADYVTRTCATYRENISMEGGINPVLTIFWQRNFDGLTNEDVVYMRNEDPLGEIQDTQSIRDKYKDMPED